MRRRYHLLVVALGMMFVAGCASGPPLLEGSLSANAATNPDANGRPSPVVVRVYELKSLAAFSSADFFSLFENESATLGADLVGREEYSLRPGESKPYRRQLQPDSKFIGVVAAFRDLENSTWRQAVALPGKRAVTLAIGVEARAVTLTLK
jgi:type VI secretion system protein VasD